MQDRHCFVPGCQSGYRKQRREYKKKGKRNPSLFKVRKDDHEMLKLWSKAIPRTDRELGFFNSVCELHFQPNEIVKQFVTRMPDGSLHRLDRGRYSLKSGAIPSIFPNSHRFPKEKSLRSEWAKATKRKSSENDSAWSPSESTYLCSNHFSPKDFEVTQVTKRLREGVVPSRFNFDDKRKEMQKPKQTYSREKDSEKNLDQQENRDVEYISCSIPGCKSKSRRKRDSSSTEKNVLMFPAPSGDRLFNKWKEVLKSEKIELTKDDHICECHFMECDIQRFYKAKTESGDIIEIKMSTPILKPNSVPSKFVNPELFNTKESSKKLSVLQNPDKVRSKKSMSGKSRFAFNSCDSGNNSIDLDIPSDSSIEKSSGSPVKSRKKQILHKNRRMSYSFLVKSIQLVKKPSMFWSVVCTDQFTVFARWNNTFVTEKRLVIEKSLTIRVFLKELEIEMTDLVDITSVDDVSALLEKVENYKI